MAGIRTPKTDVPLFVDNNISADFEAADGRTSNATASKLIQDNWIHNYITSNCSKFLQYKSTKIFVGTWNVNAKKLGDGEDLRGWLNLREGTEMVVVGFQEIVDLNAVNVAVDNKSMKLTQYWITLMQNTLGHEFQLLEYKTMVGILLLVFVKNSARPKIQLIGSDAVGVGVMGIAGNKGGVSIRLQYHDSTFCFICSHLAAHRENVKGRNDDFHNILSKSKFQIGPEAVDELVRTAGMHRWKKGNGFVEIGDHEHVFWLGDLNYRVDDSVSTEDCLSMARDRSFHGKLLDKDQLLLEKVANRVFQDFEEPTICFPPTYKYQPGTNQYECRPEKKLRAPAWCDRILWSAANPGAIKSTSYGSCEQLCCSDHKPVSSCFDVAVKVVHQPSLEQVYLNLRKILDFHNQKQTQPALSVDRVIVDFGEIKYGAEISQNVTVTNIGEVMALFRFVPKSGESQFISKPWIKVTPTFGMLVPGESLSFTVNITLDFDTVRLINDADLSLNDVLILRLENSKDYFVTVRGSYARSCFGMNLDDMVLYSEPLRSVPLDPLKRTEMDIRPSALALPKELYRIVDALYQGIVANPICQKEFFRVEGNHQDVVEIRECLDTGNEFKPYNIHSMLKALQEFLSHLSTPLILEEYLESIDNRDQTVSYDRFLKELPPIHYNSFIYLMSFFRELTVNINAQLIAKALSECFLGMQSKRRISSSSRAELEKLLQHFLTARYV